MKPIRMSLLIAVAVALFSAPAAHAYEWKVEGKALAAAETAKGSNENPATKKATPIVLSMPSLGVAIECKTATVQQEVIFPVVVVGVIIVLALCASRAESEEKKPLPCTVSEPITSTELKGEVLAIGERNYVKLKPASAAPIATIKLSGAECPLPKENKVNGEICGEGEKTGIELVIQPLTYSKESAKTCKISLSFGINSAVLSGALWSSFSGKKAGAKWGAS